MNEARLSRDHVRLEKIQKMQMHLMPETTKLQMSMMKPMMFTMIFVIGIFSWMYVMVEEFRVEYVSLPWNPKWGFNGRILLFPAWIIAYITLSAPLGRIVDRHIKLFRYRSHPLVASGEKLEEPLLVLLKEKKSKKQSNRRTQRSQRRRRGSTEEEEEVKEESSSSEDIDEASTLVRGGSPPASEPATPLTQLDTPVTPLPRSGICQHHEQQQKQHEQEHDQA